MAVAYNGAVQRVKIGKQAAQGTPAATLSEIACKPVNAVLSFDPIKYENSTGSRIGGKDLRGGQSGKLSIPLQLEAKSAGPVFAAALGVDTPVVVVATKVSRHDFTLQATSTPRYQTVQISTDGKYHKQITDAVCQSMGIEFAAGSYVEVSSDWAYADETDITAPTYTPFEPIAISAQAGTIDVAGSAPEELVSFSINVNNNTKSDKKGINNAGKPVAILHGDLEISGKISVVLNDNTAHFREKYAAGTDFPIEVLIDSGVEISDSEENYTFGISIGKAMITNINVSNDAPMMLDIDYKVIDAGADTLTMSIQNERITAY
jgi:hypothetical protein